MTLARRHVLIALSSTPGILCTSGALAQEAYPARPVRVIVPYSVGTPPDLVTRLVAARMTTTLGQSVFVDNKPGASGTIGLAELIRQPADGHTLMTMLSPITVAPALYASYAFDFSRDLAPVGQFTSYHNVLVVHPGIQAKSASELVALLKARPGDFNFASGGNATPAHLAGEVFKQQAAVPATHVPYNQFPQAIGDLLAGRVQFMFVTASVIIPHIQSGGVRALAVTGPRRVAALPGVPTMVESGFRDFDISGWDGLVARAGTPAPILSRLNAELARAARSPEVAERFGALAVEAVTGPPQQFAELIAAETRRWGALARSLGLKAE